MNLTIFQCFHTCGQDRNVRELEGRPQSVCIHTLVQIEMCEDRAPLNNSVFTPIIPANHEFSSHRNTIYIVIEYG